MASLLIIVSSSPKCIVMERLSVITLCTHPVTMTGSLLAPYFFQELLNAQVHLCVSGAFKVTPLMKIELWLHQGRCSCHQLSLSYQNSQCRYHGNSVELIEYRAYVENFLLLCVWFYGSMRSFTSSLLSKIREFSCCSESICFVVIIKYFSLHFHIIETTESGKFPRPSVFTNV